MSFYILDIGCGLLYHVLKMHFFYPFYVFFFPLFFSFNFVDKGKTAKEEARELLLKEEAGVREKVQGIQNNLSLILRALGEMAVSNPVFAHSQLPSLVCVLWPFLSILHFLMHHYRTIQKLTKI